MSHDSFGVEHHENCLDTLRLNADDRLKLLDYLRNREAQSSYDDARSFARLPYHVPGGIVMKLAHPGGNVMNYLVRPVNLSRGGMGFLHGSFVHLESLCCMMMKPLGGGSSVLPGRVAWCRHVAGRAHGVGVRFDASVELDEFVQNCLRVDQRGHASRELPKLTGRVLYISDSIDDRELLRFHLKNLGLELETALNGPEAMALVDRTHFDLVFTKYWLPGMTGAQIIAALRGDRFASPIVLLSADTSQALIDEAMAGGATEVLAMPYTFNALVSLLTRRLSKAASAAAGGSVVSEFWSDLSMRPLILAFLSRLEKQVEQLADLMDSCAPAEMVRKTAMDLRGSVAGYGYPALGKLLERVIELHGGSADLHELNRTFHEFKQLCQAACRTTG